MFVVCLFGVFVFVGVNVMLFVCVLVCVVGVCVD